MTFFKKIPLFNTYNRETMCAFNITDFKFKILANSKIYDIIKILKFNLQNRDIIMRMKTTCFDKQIDENETIFKHFKEGEDEELRCTIQNSVFYDENRIPLIPMDISCEEDEDYYIKNFGVFICNKDGQPIGFGQIIINKRLYTIVNLGVIDEYRQQGYGELLVKYLVGFCYNNSINNIYIRVEKKNTKALSLYNKIGFREIKSIITWRRNIDLF